MSELQQVMQQIREQAAAQREAGAMPGFLGGVYHDGEQIVVADGVANTATGLPMREDTGFLIGSVTKVLTTTLVMQQVERGAIDLDAPVVGYLPEFRLRDEGAAELIRVRDLLGHTNGIDADLFFLDANGPDALRRYVAELGHQCGALFPAGERISYSNGGMILAGRLLEVVTGAGYHDLLRREVYDRAGMADSSTSAKDAILRSTAVGHFPSALGPSEDGSSEGGPSGENASGDGPSVNGFGPTARFTLPDSWAPAGGTPICTIADLLAFGRTHLNGGVAPTGTRMLSAESADRMRVPSSPGTVAGAGVGLGWLLLPMGDATVLTMSGASPGGVAVLVLVPEHDLAFAAYGNAPGSFPFHDQVMLSLLREHLGVEVPRLVAEPAPGPIDLAPYAGRYRSDQAYVDVVVVDDELEETFVYEPADESQRRIFTDFVGGSTDSPPRRYRPIGGGRFAPVGIPLEALDGYLRQLIVTYDDIRDGKARIRSAGGRATRRSEA